jgi:hypothetical protein
MEVCVMVLALEREPRQKRRWGQIVARAWDDDAFRQRLLTEPASVLREEGIDVPPGVALRVIESGSAEASEEETCFWLPPSPADEDFMEDDLGRVPDVFNGGTPSRRTRTHRSSGLVLPARPAAGDLIEDDLGLAPGVFNGGTPSRRTRTHKVTG